MSTKWKQIAWFYALTWLLLLIIPVLHGVMDGGPMDNDAAAERAVAKTGLTWNSNLLVVVRLCWAEPTLWLVLFGSAIPSLAALTVVSFGPGKSQLLPLLSRLRPLGRTTSWRQARFSYLSLIPLLVACLLATYAVRWILGGASQYSHAPSLFGANLFAALLVATFLDQGAVLEELGWRGYAFAELQNGLLSPLGAAMLVGVGWGLWHIPRDVVTGVVDRLGMAQYVFLFLPSFVFGSIVVSIIAAYFMNRAGGSIIPAIMVHGLSNDAVGFSGLAPIDVALTPFYQATKAFPFAVLAILLVVFSGRRLGRQR